MSSFSPVKGGRMNLKTKVARQIPFVKLLKTEYPLPKESTMQKVSSK